MTAIVCVDRHWGIGRDGRLLFRLSDDLKRFRELTEGKTIIYGSHTLLTFPGVKPLPGRRNILLSRHALSVEGAEVAHGVLEAVEMAGEDAFVVGGETVYVELVPYCDRALVTRVDANYIADCHFPNLDRSPLWKKVSESKRIEEGELSYRYVEYARN